MHMRKIFVYRKFSTRSYLPRHRRSCLVCPEDTPAFPSSNGIATDLATRSRVPTRAQLSDDNFSRIKICDRYQLAEGGDPPPPVIVDMSTMPSRGEPLACSPRKHSYSRELTSVPSLVRGAGGVSPPRPPHPRVPRGSSGPRTPHFSCA